MRPNYKYKYNLDAVILGDSAIGKTCMLTQWADGYFDIKHHPTLGKSNR